MNLKTMLFGGYTPPDVPSRLISHDDNGNHTKMRQENFKAFGRRAATRRIRNACENAERIRAHLIAHPWSTAQQIGDALKLTKSPVYNHLLRYRQAGKVEVKSQRVKSTTMVAYNWIGEK